MLSLILCEKIYWRFFPFIGLPYAQICASGAAAYTAYITTSAWNNLVITKSMVALFV